MTAPLPLDRILQGDCIEQLNALPAKSVDVVFADPPYNLQLQGELYRPNISRVDAVTDDWDRFKSVDAYDTFTHAWLSACRRVLKDTGTSWRVITASTAPGDIILDPFFGTGTTGAVARKLGRRWIGIERNAHYAAVAQACIDRITPPAAGDPVYAPSNKPKPTRVPFARLVESGLLLPGQTLRFRQTEYLATVTADGALLYAGQRGSIHRIGTLIQGAPCNGWEHWYYHDAASDHWRAIDVLRRQLAAADEGV